MSKALSFCIDATVTEDIGLDHYTLRIDTSENGVDKSSLASFPALYPNEKD